MSTTENSPEMAPEDRLRAILYQFVTLYERWAEDRQVAAKQGADAAELVKLFTEQVKGFKELEPKVRQQLFNSIQNSTANAVKTLSEGLGKESTRAVENTAQQLAQSVYKAQCTLDAYQQEAKNTQWKIILTTVFTTVATCFLVVWLLIPKPPLPLTDEQITDLRSGQLMNLVWPKLSKKEQKHWLAITNQIEHPSET